MSGKKFILPFLVIALFMMFVFASGGSAGESSIDDLFNSHPHQVVLFPGTFDLIDGSPDTFISRNGLRLLLRSALSYDKYRLTINGSRVPEDSIVVEDLLLTADITLDDGRNDVSLEVFDEQGLRGWLLYSLVTLWAGDNTMTVYLVDSDGAPFATQTNVIASVAADLEVAARAVTSDGTVELTNIPGNAIVINAWSDNNKFGSITITEPQESVTVTVRGFSDISPYEMVRRTCEIRLPLEIFGLVDVLPYTFVSRNGLRWFLNGLRFSELFHDEYVLTVNGSLVPADSLAIEDHLFTANVTLADGHNHVSLKAVDMFGRSLFYEASLWAGDNTMTVHLVDSDGAPFTTQTTVVAAVGDFMPVAARAVTSNGTATLVNVPDRIILISAWSINNESGGITIVEPQESVTISMDRFTEIPPCRIVIRNYEIPLKPGMFGLVDGSNTFISDTFISRDGLRWLLKGIGFSTLFHDENVLTINGNRIPVDRLIIEGHFLIADVTLDDGRNDVSLEAIDDFGQSLFYEAVLWAGDNTLTVYLVDSDGEPFITETNVVASLADDQAVSARVTTSDGIATLVNIPSRRIMINARSVNNDIGHIVLRELQESVTITMRGFNPPVTTKNHDFSRGTEGWISTPGIRIELIPHVEEIPVFAEMEKKQRGGYNNQGGGSLKR